MPCMCVGNEKDKRLRTSVFIETGNKKIIIDTGPDFRQQMLREELKNLMQYYILMNIRIILPDLMM
jgi:phosphoribosyl 1,2-cyclic phosphodiesterase